MRMSTVAIRCLFYSYEKMAKTRKEESKAKAAKEWRRRWERPARAEAELEGQTGWQHMEY